MAIIKKSEIAKMSPADRLKKIAEIERSMLELNGEGRRDKVRPLKKAIAQLKTPAHPASASVKKQ